MGFNLSPERGKAPRVAFHGAHQEKFVATASPVVETVSRKRVLSAAELEKEKTGRTTPDFWEFIESMTEEMWAGDYMLYIMREDPKPSMYGGTNTLEKCPGYMIMPNGVRLKLDSREDIELAIKEKWGGKAFRLILKKGRERLTEGKCMNDAQPKYPDNTMMPQHPLPNVGQMSDTNQIASKAIDTVANKDSEAIAIAMSALRASADLIARQVAPPPPAPATNPAPASSSLDSELDRAFKAAMIQKLMAPPPNPFEMFTKFKQVLGDSNGSTPMNSIMEKFLTVAAEKVFNPAAAVTGRTTMLDIGRELVPVLGNVMHEYRLSREADARIAELTRTQQPPQQTAPALPVAAVPVPAVPASAQPAPNPPKPQPAPQKEAPSFSWVAERVARIVKNVEFPVDEAVDRVISFLYDTDERLVPLLLDPPKLHPSLKPGKEGLVQLFQFEPALASCMVNTPRVLEFIDKFMVAAKDAEEQEAKLREAAPANAAATPAPPAS